MHRVVLDYPCTLIPALSPQMPLEHPGVDSAKRGRGFEHSNTHSLSSWKTPVRIFGLFFEHHPQILSFRRDSRVYTKSCSKV